MRIRTQNKFSKKIINKAASIILTMKSEQQIMELEKKVKKKLDEAIEKEQWGVAQIKKNNLTLVRWILEKSM